MMPLGHINQFGNLPILKLLVCEIIFFLPSKPLLVGSSVTCSQKHPNCYTNQLTNWQINNGDLERYTSGETNQWTERHTDS